MNCVVFLKWNIMQPLKMRQLAMYKYETISEIYYYSFRTKLRYRMLGNVYYHLSFTK